MAERVGFEPTNESPRCWFSRPVLSTTQPPLRTLDIVGREVKLYQKLYESKCFFLLSIHRPIDHSID